MYIIDGIRRIERDLLDAAVGIGREELGIAASPLGLGSKPDGTDFFPRLVRCSLLLSLFTFCPYTSRDDEPAAGDESR